MPIEGWYIVALLAVAGSTLMGALSGLTAIVKKD